MFGGFLAFKRMAEDTARRMNNIRTAYRKLETLDNQNGLLALLIIEEDTTKPSPCPEICPVYFSIKFTPEFVNEYKKYQPAETANVMMDFAEGLEKYVKDMEEEARRIQDRSR